MQMDCQFLNFSKLVIRSMPTISTNYAYVFRAKFQNSELRAGCPNQHATLELTCVTVQKDGWLTVLGQRTGSCNNNQTVMVEMLSSNRISQTIEDRNPVFYGMESPDHAYNFTFFSYSFWHFVTANFKFFLFQLFNQRFQIN